MQRKDWGGVGGEMGRERKGGREREKEGRREEREGRGGKRERRARERRGRDLEF